MSAIVELDRVTVELGGRAVLSEVSLAIPAGAFVAVVGPNGSGKTTLLRAVYRGVARASGDVRIEGVSIDRLEQREIGQRVAVLRQEPPLAFDFLVEELVMMGRSPYLEALAGARAEDRAIVAESLAIADVAHLSKRSFGTLSGGEQQRVLLARAIAQRPKVLLLDEPTNHLDIRHQLEVLSRVKGLAITVIAALHDLNLPFAFATSAILLAEGRVVAAGTPVEVLAPARIEAVFGVDVEPLSSGDGRIVLAFRPRRTL